MDLVKDGIGETHKGQEKWFRSSEIDNNNPSLLQRGSLILEVNLTVEVDDKSLRQDCVTQVTDQFTSLFTDEESSDVEISCGGTGLPLPQAHSLNQIPRL